MTLDTIKTLCYNVVGDRDVHPKAVASPFPLFLLFYKVMEEKKMAKTCNNCNTVGNQNVAVPYVVHESAMARSERHNKRLWIVVLVLIAALIGTNLAWIIYENSFEDYAITQEVEQDADNGTNNFVGGDVYGETEDKNND